MRIDARFALQQHCVLLVASHSLFRRSGWSLSSSSTRRQSSPPAVECAKPLHAVNREVKFAFSCDHESRHRAECHWPASASAAIALGRIASCGRGRRQSAGRQLHMRTSASNRVADATAAAAAAGPKRRTVSRDAELISRSPRPSAARRYVAQRYGTRPDESSTHTCVRRPVLGASSIRCVVGTRSIGAGAGKCCLLDALAPATAAARCQTAQRRSAASATVARVPQLQRRRQRRCQMSLDEVVIAVT